MENKFNLSVEENLFIARRNIINYIWESAKLEGLEVTFIQTSMIYDNISVPHIRVDHTIAVYNLKYAWNFITQNVTNDIDIDFVCKINRVVGGNSLVNNAGTIRKIGVSMGGTDWKPNLPNKRKIKEGLESIKLISNSTERAITLMLYCMRTQMFEDGNKRTSMLAANRIMIANGVGILSVPVKYQKQFNKLLVKFYETNNYDIIKLFIYDHCIDGINL